MDRASPFTTDYRREVRAGLRDIAPIVVAAVPISLLFGAVAAAKGLTPLEVTVMSALVFAGGAQFAVIAPTALTTGWAEAIAAGITAVAAFRLPLLGTIAVGVISVVVLRNLI